MSLKKETGVSLIEVLVTVVILATALMTIAALQTRSIQFNQSAYMRSQANIFAYDILDRIRINRGADSANISTYNVAYGGNVPASNAVASADITAWRANITAVLPGGDGAINCVAATKVCTVSIRWLEEQIEGELAADNPEAQTEFIYSTSI
jgi:type IV pilus assembly protein PilV